MVTLLGHRSAKQDGTSPIHENICHYIDFQLIDIHIINSIPLEMINIKPRGIKL